MNKWDTKMKSSVVIPEIVKDRVDDTLAQIRKENVVSMKNQSKRNRPVMNIATKVAILAVMVLAIGAGSVYAATYLFGMKDFVKNLPDDAKQYINKDVKAKNDEIKTNDVETVLKSEEKELKDKVKFTVRETVFDHTDCHITIEVNLMDAENYLLVPEVYQISKTKEFYTAADKYYSDANEGESFEEYAMRNGKTLLLVESLLGDEAANDAAYGASYDTGIVEDKSHVLLHLNVSSLDENKKKFEDKTEIPILNKVLVYSEGGNNELEECFTEKMNVVLEGGDTTKEERASYALDNNQEMRVEGGPVILKSIVLHNSALETKVTFTIINEDKELGNWISVNLIDDDGNIFDRGTSDGGSASVPDSSGKFTDNRSYKKMELPDHVNVRIRNLDTDEIYELKNIPIAKE